MFMESKIFTRLLKAEDVKSGRGSGRESQQLCGSEIKTKQWQRSGFWDYNKTLPIMRECWIMENVQLQKAEFCYMGKADNELCQRVIY